VVTASVSSCLVGFFIGGHPRERTKRSTSLAHVRSRRSSAALAWCGGRLMLDEEGGAVNAPASVTAAVVRGRRRSSTGARRRFSSSSGSAYALNRGSGDAGATAHTRDSLAAMFKALVRAGEALCEVFTRTAQPAVAGRVQSVLDDVERGYGNAVTSLHSPLVFHLLVVCSAAGRGLLITCPRGRQSSHNLSSWSAVLSNHLTLVVSSAAGGRRGSAYRKHAWLG
jgi:hypothetical protein